MKTNKLVARVRVETEHPESEVLKPYLIEVLAEQAGKVFEGLIKENPALYDLTMNEKGCKDGEVEFSMEITIADSKTRRKLEIAEYSIILSDFIAKIKE